MKSKMTVREAFEASGIKIIKESPNWNCWVAQKGDKEYVIRRVDGRTDWKDRYTVDRRTGDEDNIVCEKLCTRANFEKVVSMIKND